MGGVKRQLAPEYRSARACARAPIMPIAKENTLLAGLHLMPNSDHYVRISLPGDAREFKLTQNQMKLMLELLSEATGHITIDDGHTDRLYPAFVPLGSGGRY